MKHELESDSDDLGWGVWRFPCGSVVNSILDLIDQGLKRLIYVLGRTEPIVVVLESGGGNFSIGRIKIVK